MSYRAEISRRYPSAIVLLIDQSGSMAEPWGADKARTKASVVADIANRFLQTLVYRCARDEGVRDYYDVGILGYGQELTAAFGGTGTELQLWPLSRVATSPKRVEDRKKKVEDGAGGVIDAPIKFPVWLDPVASGATPMCAALRATAHALETWVGNHPESYPPTIVNITDGEATDGDPVAAAQLVTDLATDDGNLLLFNAHISAGAAQEIVFPGAETQLPDGFARRLFDMSSELPPESLEIAREYGMNVQDGCRGFVYQASPESLIQFVDIGTRKKLPGAEER